MAATPHSPDSGPCMIIDLDCWCHLGQSACRIAHFRIAHEVARENGCQYLASLNESNLTAIREKMEDPSEFGPLFTEDTVPELTDDSDEGELLGITVDLIYDGRK